MLKLTQLQKDLPETNVVSKKQAEQLKGGSGTLTVLDTDMEQ